MSSHLLHREEKTAIGVSTDVVDRHDVGVIELSSHPCLSEEAQLVRTTGLFAVRTLDRHGTLHLSIDGRNDHAIATPAQLSLLGIAMVQLSIPDAVVRDPVGEAISIESAIERYAVG